MLEVKKEHPHEEPRKDGLALSVERHLRTYFAAHEDGLPAAGLYDRVVQAIEIPLLSVVLEECGGNQIKAAALLGLNRNTLRKKIRQLGLSIQKGSAAQDKRGL